MAVTSNRSVTLQFTGDVEYTQEFDAMPSAVGSGQNDLVALSTGNNTITVPTNAVGATIIMPANNTVQVTLKGVNGDADTIKLSLTDPCSISLNGVTSFVLKAASAVTVRIIFS